MVKVSFGVGALGPDLMLKTPSRLVDTLSDAPSDERLNERIMLSMRTTLIIDAAF